MAYITYPRDFVEFEAEDAQVYTSTRTRGVYADDHFTATVTGADTNVTLGIGMAWVKIGTFTGMAFASTTPVLLDNLPLADPSQDRYDLITIDHRASNNYEGEIAFKSGVPSSNPQIPTVQQDSTIHELGVYAVFRPVGSTVIRPQDIIDLRLNGEYCGIMRDGVTGIDTSVINAQVEDMISTLKADSDKALADLETAFEGIVDRSNLMLTSEFVGESATKTVKASENGINEYTQTALNTIVGAGANGYFTATVSGTVSQINDMNIKSGEDAEIELIAGVMYWFTIVGNTINFRQGGASRNYKIIASTTQSTSPKENTIWINTETPMPSNGWAFANENPFLENPVLGNVWLQTKDTATIELSTSKNVLEQQKINSIYQYNGTSWISVKSQIYQNGEWIDFERILMNFQEYAVPFEYNKGYYNNSFYTEIGTFQVTADEISRIVYAPLSSIYYHTTEKIDLTHYSTIIFDVSYKSTEFPAYVLVSSTKYAFDTGSTIAEVRVQTAGTFTIDVSAIVGEYYIGFAGRADVGTGAVNVQTITLS